MANTAYIVQIDGVNYGEWDADDGVAAAWANSTRPSPTGGVRMYEGRKTHGDRTVSIAYVPSRDPQIVALIRKLVTSDRPPNMVVVAQPLDENRQVFGKPLATATGKVASYNAGSYDVTSDEPQSLEVVMSVESVA